MHVSRRRARNGCFGALRLRASLPPPLRLLLLQEDQEPAEGGREGGLRGRTDGRKKTRANVGARISTKRAMAAAASWATKLVQTGTRIAGVAAGRSRSNHAAPGAYVTDLNVRNDLKLRLSLKPTASHATEGMATVEVQYASPALDHEGVDLGVVIGTKVEETPQDPASMDHLNGFALALDTTATTDQPHAVAKVQDLEILHKQQLHRTTFHYQPAKNWMNDPNAPMYYKGYYHLFYQYNPEAPVWGNLTWGHAVSKDLVHWLYLEDALKPDQWYDVMGVWSGSATIGADGIPFILYTGGSGLIENTGEQLQCMAVPADPSDPFLREWVKVPQNPILKHPTDVGIHNFRDPSTAWQQADGTWVFTVGAKVGEIGVALQYKSRDLQNWEFLEEKLLHSGPAVGMWECLDFFPVEYHTLIHSDIQKYVLKVSLLGEQCDYYTIGTYDEAAHKFIPDHPELDIGLGFRMDYGKYYASKSFYDPVKRRQIMWAWVPESCPQEMDLQKGWSSIQGIPRTMALDSNTGVNLIQWPIEEIDSLRGPELSQTDVKLEAGAVMEVKGTAGDQLDVEVVFEYPDVSNVGALTDEAKLNALDSTHDGYEHRGIFGPFGLLVLTDENFHEQTAVFFYIAQSSDGQWTTRFCNDQSRSSVLPDDIHKPVYGGYVKILPTENFLTLRVLVDRSIVESFVQGGRMVVTSRVYPSVAIGNLANLYLFNNGMTPITVRNITAYPMTRAVLRAL